MSTAFADIDCDNFVSGARDDGRQAAVQVARAPLSRRDTPIRPDRLDRHDAPGRHPTGAVRLTRRGRLVLLVVVLAVAFGALTLLGGPAASTAQVHHSPAHTVVVEPGETLWDIASSIAPDKDPRGVIAEIVDLNSLTDAGSIRVGQPLFIPAQ